MATEIDSLQISINAKAKSAEDSVDTLIRKLDALSTSLARVNGSSLSGLANGVHRLGMATQTLKGLKATDYNRIARGFERFSRIDSSGLSQTANGLNTLARGMVALSTVPNIQNVTPAINAIKNLARVDMSGFDTAKMTSIANTISSFANQLSSVGAIESSVTRVISAMARLSGSGQYIGNVVAFFPQLGNQVVSLVSSLSGAGVIDIGITKVVEGIARLASAGKKVQYTVANLQALGDGVVNLIDRLRNVPQLNSNIANTIQGLGNLAVSGSRAGTVVNGLGSNVSRTTNLFSRFSSVLNRSNKSSKGFVSTIGMFYAKFFFAIRAVKAFGRAIGSAQDYIEDFNYFSVALTKVGEDARDNWKEAGYDSAQSYVDSFKTRFQELQKQMTGYNVNAETGELDYNIGHNLGLNISEVMKFQSAITQITNSAGMLGETSIMTSKALSMLSADLGSLSNQDLSAVQENLQSGLIGQSRALYKYGIDITQAGLQQTAYAHGLDVTVKNLSQASKMQLRLLTILSQSKVAYGDLARTINQPANQLRMLQAGFSNLGRTIGQIFLPIIQKIYPYLNAVVMVLQEFAEWIAKLTGANLKGADTSFNFPDYTPAEDGSEIVAENTAKAAKSAKKLSDNLQGFDIINKLDDNSSSDGDGGSGGSGSPSNVDLSKEIAKALANYEKIWNDTFKSNENKAVQLAEKIKKALLDGWKKGDFTEVGKSLANWLNNGMRKIPWNNIKNGFNKVAKSLATFLKGAIGGLDWSLVGTTLAEGFNTATDSLYTFITTFDWLTFGKGIGTGLNAAINRYDWTKLGQALGSSMRGIIQTAFGFVTNFDFSQFGTKIGNAINGFFQDMGKVDTKTGLTGWQELGKSISDSISGILDTINTALSTVKWKEVGKSIGQFIGSIDWWGIMSDIGVTVSNALWAGIKTAISAVTEDPAGMFKAVTAVFTGLFVAGKLKGLKTTIKDKLKKPLSEGIMKAVNAINSTQIGAALSSKIGSAKGLAISVAIAAVSFKFAQGTWERVFDEYSQEEISSALKDLFKNAFNSIPGEVFTWFTTGGLAGEIINQIVKAISGKDAKDRLAEGFAGAFEGLGTIFSGKYSGSEWADAFSATFTDLGDTAANYSKKLVDKVKPYFTKKKWEDIGAGIKSGIQSKWNSLYTWFTGTAVGKFISSLKTKLSTENIKSAIGSFKNAIKEKWQEFTEWWNDKKTGFNAFYENLRNKFSAENMKKAFSNIGTALKDAFSAGIEAVKQLWNSFAKGLNAKLKLEIPNIDIAGKKVFDKKTLNFGKLPTFQTGGFPEDGLFLANHNELVGKFSNGQTAVANNQQITDGIAKAVAPAVYSAMMQALANSANSDGTVVINLDGKKIAESTIGHVNQITKSRGRNPIVGLT